MDDYYFGEKTLEKAEIKMQKEAINNILNKNKLFPNDIDILIGGDLSNQLALTSFAIKDYEIPFIGVYSACAIFAESLLLGANLLSNSNFNKILTITSSHNLTAERQFRYPVEYGSQKPKTTTFTTTGSVATILTNKRSKIKIESATIGTPVDLEIKDVFNMGAVMAPSAAKVIYDHLNDLKRDISYYDLVLTGDLGCVGVNILKDYISKVYNINILKYQDAGCLLYLDSQDTYSGGSGPVCLPLIFFNKIIKSKKYHKILIVATGSLHSPTLVNQKNSIPGIAHAISLEVD